jgi:calcineurin-like phosphoesterase family protein
VAKAVKFRKRIKCKQIFYVWGNHDKYLRKKKEFEDCFVKCADLLNVTYEEQCIVLSHYSFRVWDKRHYGSWNLYGHSHGSLPDDPDSKGLDVGVDCWDWKPVSFTQIKERMALKNNKPLDHHIAEEEGDNSLQSLDNPSSLKKEKEPCQ